MLTGALVLIARVLSFPAAVSFASSYDAVRGLLWMTFTLLAMSVASLLLYVAAPEIAMVAYENATVLRLGGIFGNANQVGEIAALGLLLTFVVWFQRPTRATLLLMLLAVPMCAVCLVMSQSRSSILGAGAAIVAVVLRRHPLLLLPTVSIGAALLVVVYAYPDAIDVLIGLVARSGNVTQVTTLTGRTEIWQFVLSAITKAPVLGYGFASTRELIPEGHAFAYGWTTTSAHNLWLQAWVTTGAVGLALVLLNQLASLSALQTRPNPARDAVFVFVISTGLLESGPVGPTVSVLTFVWIWATALSMGSQEVNR